METAPSLETVKQALQALYINPDAVGKKKASVWLGELQRSVHAWHIADQLLTLHQSPEACYFAAQTMRTKIKHSFHELPSNVHQSLRDSLLMHAGKVTADTAPVIVTQLSLALADIALQMVTWKSPVQDLVQKFGSNAPHVAFLLDILIALPEEINSHSLHLDANRRDEVMGDLKSSSEVVLHLLSACSETMSSNAAIQIKVLKCLSSWYNINAIPETIAPFKIIVNKPVKTKEPVVKREPRKLYVARHAERMDFPFGKSFCDKVFDSDGNYKPTDLNMPKIIPKRATNQWHYTTDAPLTRIGCLQASLTGEWLHDKGVVLHHVYVSPAYRCVKTAKKILEELGQRDLMLHIEPGIFEWLGWYQSGLPVWFKPSEFKALGYNIDLTYKPIVPQDKLDKNEDIGAYYRRSDEVAKKILQKHQTDGGHILILGHAGTLEVCTRQLLGKSPRTSQEFLELCSKVPYCGLIACQEEAQTKKWSVIDTPIPHMTHGHNIHGAKNLLYPS